MRFLCLLVGSMSLVLLEAFQPSSIRPVDQQALREYEGAYKWTDNSFVYLQLWSEFSGKPELVAFDESGEVRTLYPTDRDKFFAGPGCAIPGAVESRIEFHRNRDGRGHVTDLETRRSESPKRTADRY